MKPKVFGVSGIFGVFSSASFVAKYNCCEGSKVFDVEGLAETFVLGKDQPVGRKCGVGGLTPASEPRSGPNPGESAIFRNACRSKHVAINERV
jgi:hypothetical protein